MAIVANIVRLSEGSTLKYLSQHFLDNHFTLSKFLEDDVAFMPKNDKSMVENFLRTNIFRSNKLIQNNLALLFKNLFSKSSLFDKTLDMIDRLFEDIDEVSKKDEE